MPSDKISGRDLSTLPPKTPLKITNKGNLDPSMAVDTTTVILVRLDLATIIATVFSLVFSPVECTERLGAQLRYTAVSSALMRYL